MYKSHADSCSHFNFSFSQTSTRVSKTVTENTRNVLYFLNIKFHKSKSLTLACLLVQYEVRKIIQLHIYLYNYIFTYTICGKKKQTVKTSHLIFYFPSNLFQSSFFGLKIKKQKHWKMTLERDMVCMQLDSDDSAILQMTIKTLNLLVYYSKCCNLIGYATRYLFVNRYRVATSKASFSSQKPVRSSLRVLASD